MAPVTVFGLRTVVCSKIFRFTPKHNIKHLLSIHLNSHTVCAISVRLYQTDNKPRYAIFNMACPGNRMRWDLTPADLTTKADALIARSQAVYDAVGALKPNEVTYENVMKVLIGSYFKERYLTYTFLL